MRRYRDVQDSDEDESCFRPITLDLDGLAETSGDGTNGQYTWRISNHHIISTLNGTHALHHTRCGLRQLVCSVFTIAVLRTMV
jgi:hypothetical protein